MTVMFSTGQSIQMTDLGLGNGSWAFGWLFQDAAIDPPNTSAFTINNSYVDLLDAQGGVLRSIYTGMDSSGVAHIGPEARGFLSLGDPLQISGYHTYFDVVSIQNNPSHYCGPWFYLGADQLQLNGAGAGNGIASCGGSNYTGGGVSDASGGSNYTGGGSDGGDDQANTVPEPEIYTLLLAGLGLLGFTARRKKQSA